MTLSYVNKLPSLGLKQRIHHITSYNKESRIFWISGSFFTEMGTKRDKNGQKRAIFNFRFNFPNQLQNTLQTIFHTITFEEKCFLSLFANFCPPFTPLLVNLYFTMFHLPIIIPAKFHKDSSTRTHFRPITLFQSFFAPKRGQNGPKWAILNFRCNFSNQFQNTLQMIFHTITFEESWIIWIFCLPPALYPFGYF